MALPIHQSEWSMPSTVVDPFSTAAVRFMTQRHWTEPDLTHLPPENRYEIIDGRLLVTPPASEEHQRWCSWVFRALDRAAPDGWRILWDIGLQLGDDLFIPDLVVLSPDAPRAEKAYNEVLPAVVVEVESRSTKSVDRVDKFERYGAGVGAYWRIERTGKVNIYRLDGDGGYGDPLVLSPGETVDLDYPYPVTVSVPAP